MSYTLKEVTIRTDNSEEGLARISELWGDVFSGKLPVIENGMVPVARYANYSKTDPLTYDFTILGWYPSVIRALNSEAVDTRRFIHFSTCANCEIKAIKEAWDLVRAAEANGSIKRAYANDYEITTRPDDADIDKPYWCELYISVEPY